MSISDTFDEVEKYLDENYQDIIIHSFGYNDDDNAINLYAFEPLTEELELKLSELCKPYNISVIVCEKPTKE
jgi:dTDP-4-dehydrorhamnose reductase